MLNQFKNKNLSEITPSRLSKAFIRRVKDIPHRISWDLNLKYMLKTKKRF